MSIGVGLFGLAFVALAEEGNVKLPAKEPKTREFSFQYQFRVKGLKAQGDAAKDRVRVWLPSPSSDAEQQVTRGEATAPAKIAEHQESRFGNRILYFETQIPASGEFSVKVPYQVKRHEVRQLAAMPGASEKLDDMRRALYLAADKLVPTSGKPLKLLEGLELRANKIDMARQLYDLVDKHVVYKKEGIGWGRGDTNWVCDSGFGNCTDFHSLFISLARSRGLPARFEIGFSIPTDKTEGPVAGYHCWAWFYLEERGWVPVDISEADKNPAMKEYYFGNLTADRVKFSTGRDLKLNPPSAQQPLNFFVFPYIEVGGETLPAANIELQNSFRETG